MQLTWGDALPIWWSFFWRATIYGFVLGALFGMAGGALAGASGNLGAAEQWGGIGGLAAGIPASMLAVKQAVNKHAPEIKRLVND